MMKKIKVCHITSAHQRHDVRIFEKECVSLSNFGYNVYEIVNDDAHDEEYKGVHIVSTGVLPANRLERMFKSMKYILKLAIEIDADIYHLHDPELLRIAKKLLANNKKVIFDSHEFSAMQILTKAYIPIWARGIMSKIYKKYEFHILRTIDGLVVPCTYDGKDYFENIDIPKVIIGNCPITDADDSILPDSHTHVNEEKACYLGGITEARGIFSMVRGCHRVGIKLRLIGKISDELLEKINNMPEAECVEMLGVLNHEEALLKASECMIGLSLLQDIGQYSKIDNLPTKVYEYMQMGMPVVVSKFPFYENIISEYKFGIAVNPQSPEEIAEAIEYILKNPLVAQEMGEAGKRAVNEKYNWEVEASRLYDFYATILS